MNELRNLRSCLVDQSLSCPKFGLESTVAFPDVPFVRSLNLVIATIRPCTCAGTRVFSGCFDSTETNPYMDSSKLKLYRRKDEVMICITRCKLLVNPACDMVPWNVNIRYDTTARFL